MPRLFPTVFAQKAGEDSDEGEVARAMSRAWIRFASDLNPNGPESKHSMSLAKPLNWHHPHQSIVPFWPVYDSSAKRMLQIRARNMSIISDDFRAEAIRWMTHDNNWTYLTGR